MSSTRYQRIKHSLLTWTARSLMRYLFVVLTVFAGLSALLLKLIVTQRLAEDGTLRLYVDKRLQTLSALLYSQFSVMILLGQHLTSCDTGTAEESQCQSSGSTEATS